MTESRKNSESEEEVWGFGEEEIPARKNLINLVLESEENSSFKSLADYENNKSANDDQIEKELRPPPGPFQMWLEDGAKARITADNPGAKPAVLAKLAGDAYCALDLNVRRQWEDRNNAELQAYWLRKQKRVPGRPDSRVVQEAEKVLLPVSQQVELHTEMRRPRVKKKTLREKKEDARSARQRAYKAAVAGFKSNKFGSLHQAAKVHGLVHSTLYRAMKKVWDGDAESEEFPGSGKFSSRLSAQEEQKIVNVVTWSAKIGYGIDWPGLQSLLQEVLLALVAADQSRKTGLEKVGQLPGKSWVREFARRHNLVVRQTLEISKGRQVVTPEEVAMWQGDAYAFFSSDPEMTAALLDPGRVWNQDESSVQVGLSDDIHVIIFILSVAPQLGVTGRKVLAPRGTKLLYQVASSSRDHITCSLSVNARGDMAPCRCVFQGVRNMATIHLKDLPKDGLSGAWKLCVSPKGYITAELFVDVLRDIVETVEKLGIPRPIILFLDGAAPHISLAMAEYCKTFGIQPWLLKPNSTHLLQPLDLTFLKVLKGLLKQKCITWQQDPRHVGSALTKYSIVFLLREAVEEVLASSPNTIASGFRRGGLSPWNPAAVNTGKMLPSTVFAQTAIPEPVNAINRNQLLHQWSGEILDGGDIGCYAEEVQEVPREQSSVNEVPEEQISVKEVPGEQTSLKEIPKEQTSVIEVPEEQTSVKEVPPSLQGHANTGKVHEEEAATRLQTFELVFLSKDKVAKFRESWSKECEDSDSLYPAWLAMKRATIPTPLEALDQVLASKVPCNVPRRAKESGGRAAALPKGIDRHNLTSPAWMEVHERDAANRETKKTKEAKKIKKPIKSFGGKARMIKKK